MPSLPSAGPLPSPVVRAALPPAQPWRRARGCLLALVVAVWLLGAALSASTAAAQTGGTTAPASCTPQRATGRFFIPMTVNGSQRSALVNVPPGSDGTHPLPLVLAFHGAGATGPFMEPYSGLSALGDRAGFITVYPTSNFKFWNLDGSGPQGDDDIVFIRALLGRLDEQLCVDDQRIYATGVSNGAGFTARLGCDLADRLAAIAPVAGLYGVQPPCQPQRPLSVLEIHGSADTTVPYTGYGPNGQGAVPTFLQQWETLDGCPPTSPTTRLVYTRGAILSDRSGCAAGSRVTGVELLGGPHTWPGSVYTPPDGFGEAPSVSASLTVWDFFRCVSLTPSAPPAQCLQTSIKAARAGARPAKRRAGPHRRRS